MAESGVPWEENDDTWCCPECFILYSINVFRVSAISEWVRGGTGNGGNGRKRRRDRGGGVVDRLAFMCTGGEP